MVMFINAIFVNVRCFIFVHIKRNGDMYEYLNVE